MDEIKITHRKIEIEGLKEQYRFLHITDLHMTCFGEDEDEERAAYARPRAAFFSRPQIPAEHCLEAFVDYANREKLSGVLFTGDILDFPSKENLSLLKSALASLEVPYVFAVGNHDWSYFNDYHTEASLKKELPLFGPFTCGDTAFHTVRIGEITFAAMDNSMERYYEDAAVRLSDALSANENVILLQHIPLYAETLHEDTVHDWGRDITLGGKEGLRPDDTADRVREVICRYPSLKAIIAGHLHFSHEDVIDGTVTQYVTKLSCYGEAVLFEITGKQAPQA